MTESDDATDVVPGKAGPGDDTETQTSPIHQPHRIIAGIVVFNPEAKNLLMLVARLLDEPVEIILFLNSRMPPWLHAAVESKSVSVLGTSTNHGVGVAHNAIAACACERGYHFLLLFDQDSLPEAGLVARLHTAIERLRAARVNPAVIGSNIVAASGIVPRTPRSIGTLPNIAHLRKVEFVISSGTLLDLQAYAVVGPFREDFFIDFVEVEWCLRARRSGYTCWISDNVHLKHNFGLGVSEIPFFQVRVTKQSPLRSYTFIRNQLAMLRLPHVSKYEKVRILGRCAVQTLIAPAISGSPTATLIQVLRGWFDGARNRLGPP